MNLWNPAGASLLVRIPLSWIFGVLAALRRTFYQRGWLRVERVDVPVIVVGNITVGGSGKTPLTIWLVDRLGEWGWQPGIASRGYGGQSRQPALVESTSDPARMGDEPVMLARRTGRPVVVAKRRVEAAKALRQSGCTIIVADDGLQHYALGRDLEIVMVDGTRRFGNGRLLPAGPLREPISRLESVDIVVTKGHAHPGEFGMELTASCWRNVTAPDLSRPPGFFNDRSAHGVAGIAYPPSFFEALRRLGIRVIEHSYPDHHVFAKNELAFDDDLPVLMTEKDAVKCQRLGLQNAWYLEVEACFDTAFVAALRERLERMRKTSGGA